MKYKYSYHPERIASEWEAYCDIMTPQAEALGRQLKPAMDALWESIQYICTDYIYEDEGGIVRWKNSEISSAPDNQPLPEWQLGVLKILLAAGLVDKEMISDDFKELGVPPGISQTP